MATTNIVKTGQSKVMLDGFSTQLILKTINRVTQFKQDINLRNISIQNKYTNIYCLTVWFNNFL